MSFANIWPLFFILAIPAIIILYILRPKGKDTEVSSALLWRRLFRNLQSRSFFEKFKKDLLMYLQILAMILLILSLMAPFITIKMHGGGSTLIIIDKSLSMQHEVKGESRLDEAKERAKDLLRTYSGDVSILTVGSDSGLIATHGSDTSILRELIDEITAEEAEGSLADAYPMVLNLACDRVIIFTDADGVAQTENYTEHLDADVFVCGEPSYNVSLDYLAAVKKEELYDISARFTNYGDDDVSFDLTLYDAEGNIIAVTPQTVEAGKSGSAIQSDIAADGGYISGRISNIRFLSESGRQDSLELDNEAYALLHRAGESRGILISSGNTFLERAYYAVTGEDLAKSSADSAVRSGGYNLVIYDSGFERTSAVAAKEGEDGDGAAASALNILQFNVSGRGTLSNMVVHVPEGELTGGLKDFSIGANQVTYYDCPEWATPFMEADGRCVGYYGINGDHKEVVVGFDVRETDFPVKAEFPVFMASAIKYLSDLNILADDSYLVGETLSLNPASMVDLSTLTATDALDPEAKVNGMTHAGLYIASAGDQSEYYLVQLPKQGRDARAEAEDIRSGNVKDSTLGKKGIRNILLVVALLLLILEWLLYVKRMNYRRKFYWVLRGALLLLLILSLFGLQVRKKSKENTTIFLVDMSVSDEDNIRLFGDYIDDTLHDMPAGNSYGIICFGRDSQVDQFVTDRDMYMGLDAKVDATATNFELALQRAASLMTAEGAGRIVVLTDGRETAGDVERTAALFNTGEIELDAILIETPEVNDVYISAVDMPEVLHAGERYYMTVTAQSNFETDAVIIITSGGKEVGRENVHLQRGSNSFVFEEEVTDDSLESFEVSVLTEEDGCEENNSYSAYARVEDAPRVLVLYGQREDKGSFMTLLDAAHVNSDFVRADKAPDTLPEMLEYKAIILENAYLDELPEGFVDNLETFVRDYGGGFVCTGGEDSYMMGGYNDTPIETVLPVNMELRGTVEIPSTAIVMVIDHSGSMSSYAGHGATYLDVAVEAAKRGVDNLRSTDEIGVLAFDDVYTWAHPLSQVGNHSQVKQDIETITDGGGTVIKPALEAARQALLTCSSQVRHIILLTDGYGETTNFSDVTSALVRDGITLSTVAVGVGSDTTLMQQLAQAARGRYYYADADTDIPRIFAQEVFLGGGTYIRNGDFEVVQRNSSEITSGLFSEGWYHLWGYVSGSPKTGATQLLTTAGDDPLLTVWQYGLGKTVAWNSDVDGGWSSSYVGTEDYAALWKRITDYVTGTPDIGADYLDVETRDGQTILSYHTENYDDSTVISGMMFSPDGEGGDVNFTASEPGVYTAELDTVSTGLYHFNVRRSDDDEITGAFNTATVVQYSDEYRFDVSEDAFRNFIDRYGRMLDLDDYLWEKIASNRSGFFSLTEIFLSLLILLYLLDIAGRRFGFDPQFGRKRKAVPQNSVDEELMQLQNMSGEPGAMPVQEQTASVKKAPKPAQETKNDGALDTSALLQKKKDRNI